MTPQKSLASEGMTRSDPDIECIAVTSTAAASSSLLAVWSGGKHYTHSFDLVHGINIIATDIGRVTAVKYKDCTQGMMKLRTDD